MELPSFLWIHRKSIFRNFQDRNIFQGFHARRCISCIVVNTFPCSWLSWGGTIALGRPMGKSWKIICNWREFEDGKDDLQLAIFNFFFSVHDKTCVSLGKIEFSMSWVKVGWWENLLSNRSNFSYHVLTHIETIVGQGWEPLNVVNPSLNIQIWWFFLIWSKTQKLG